MKKDVVFTPEDFLEAWRGTWKDTDKPYFVEKFQGNNKPWTECMLTGEDSFLRRVGKKLGIVSKYPNGHMFQEGGGYYRLDMVFNADDNNGYPHRIDVAIEHENDKCPQNEMWKLIFLRSPLKVIIFYNYYKDSLQDKVNELWKMLRDANDAFSENKDTNYLFVIGELTDDQLRWRWSSDRQHSLQELC